MADLGTSSADLRLRLALLEPLRRRVIRVYWTRGLLALLLLTSAAALAVAASIASTLWVARATGASGEAELVVRIVPLVLAFVGPFVAIALGAFLAVAAIVRSFGRATVLEYDSRFRQELVAPLLRAAVPGAHLELEGRIDDAALEASALFTQEKWAGASGGLLVQGRADGVAFAASTLHIRARGGRLGRRVSVFRGLFGSVQLPGRFDGTILVSDPDGGGWPGSSRRPLRLQPVDVGDPAFALRFAVFARDSEQALRDLGAPVRALLLELRSRAGAPLCVSLHAGGLAIAVPGRREPFRPERVRPSDAEELTRQAGLYALVREAARALAGSPLNSLRPPPS